MAMHRGALVAVGVHARAATSVLDDLGAERDAAWAEAKRLKAALGVEAGG